MDVHRHRDHTDPHGDGPAAEALRHPVVVVPAVRAALLGVAEGADLLERHEQRLAGLGRLPQRDSTTQSNEPG